MWLSLRMVPSVPRSIIEAKIKLLILLQRVCAILQFNFTEISVHIYLSLEIQNDIFRLTINISLYNAYLNINYQFSSLPGLPLIIKADILVRLFGSLKKLCVSRFHWKKDTVYILAVFIQSILELLRNLVPRLEGQKVRKKFVGLSLMLGLTRRVQSCHNRTSTWLGNGLLRANSRSQ